MLRELLPLPPIKRASSVLSVRGWVSRALLLLIVAATVALSTGAEEPRASQVVRLERLAVEIATDYPAVAHISPEELRRSYPDALLIDVRAPAEYSVSRLPGAQRADSAADIDVLAEQSGQRPIVFYCSVGWRSAEAAQAFNKRQVAAAGTRQVFNLTGSLFAWANQGRPLEDENGPTTAVHPYNAWWGMRYLDPDRPRLDRD